MKTTIMHLMSLFLILAFSASCGKKEGGSSGSSSNNVNTPVNNGLNTTGQLALTNLLAWYNSTAEGSLPTASIGRGDIIKAVDKQSISSNCIDLGFFGDACFSAGGGNWTTTILPTMPRNTGAKSNVVAVNEALAPLVGGANTRNLILLNGVNSITQQQSPVTSGVLYTITYKVNNTQKMVMYQIDTGYNSAVNPVGLIDEQNNKKERLNIGQTYGL